LIHPEEFGSEERLAGASSKLSGNYSTITDLFAKCKWTSPSNSGSYSSTHPVQSRFIQDLIDCICIDCLPLDFIQRPSFIKLIRNLNSQIRLVSRTTLSRKIRTQFKTEVQEKLKKVFRSIENRCLHVMLDLWTDRQKQSILGIKVQFITKDWKIQNYTIGFRHFTQRHDAPCIRRVFDSVLHDTYGIKPENVGFIVGDNASNMIAAFKSDYPPEFPLHDVDEMSDDTDQWEDMEEFSDCEDSDNTDIEDKILSDVITELQKFKKSSLTKLPCFCHLLQLVIKDSILSNTSVKELVKSVKTLKSFFHNSPFWYSKLKAIAGKGLVNQADTRWNTVQSVMERLIDPKVREALDTVLRETMATKTPCKVSFSCLDYNKMEIMSNLLSPLTEATNALQANHVTSSLVIPVLTGAYKAILDVNVEGDADMQELKQALLSSMQDRFGLTISNPTEKSKKRTIVRQSIYSDENLILATMLDPRFKSICFNGENILNGGQTSAVLATKMLEEKYQMEKGNLETAVSQTVETVEENPATKSKSLLHHIREEK
ncbi:unnamed protein product, partial [Allacma fusca]